MSSKRVEQLCKVFECSILLTFKIKESVHEEKRWPKAVGCSGMIFDLKRSSKDCETFVMF